MATICKATPMISVSIRVGQVLLDYNSLLAVEEKSPAVMASAYGSRLHGLGRAGRFSVELDKPGSQHTDENDNQRIQRKLVLHSGMGDVVHHRVAKQH